MFETVGSARRALEELAREFEPGALSAAQAVRMVEQLGAIRRLTDGLLAKAAKRAHDTKAHTRSGHRDAAHLVASTVGIGTTEAKQAISTAAKLEHLSETDAAVRAGRVSATAARMIADATAVSPQSEGTLIEAASRGLTPLRDVCLAVRAAAEDPRARAARQHAARSFRMWTADDGMFEGHLKVTPEIGGRLKAVIDRATDRAIQARRGRDFETREAHAADALSSTILDSKMRGAIQSRVHIVIDHGALVRGQALAGEQCEIAGVGPVSVAWVRELLGEAFVTAVVKRGKDITTVAHLGRHIPAEVETALIVSGRECDIEACHGRGYLERDHSEIDHAKGGPTALWNLQWLCATHHKRKTAGWVLGERDPVTRKRALSPPEPRAA
jgi:Domain of unknown function (DUF222)